MNELRGTSRLASFKLPQSPALIVASDVHIRAATDERYELLCQLVEEAIRVKAKTFVLNGDIFDFFFGWRSHFRSKYKKLLMLMDNLVASGADVWFVEGNHEFALDGLNRHFRFKIVPSDGRIVMSPDGKRILVAHGDLLSPDYHTEFFVLLCAVAW
jgi:UDP-2,3-diacylglucosamine hydrolase